MRLAYQNLKEGTQHFDQIKSEVTELIDRWNDAHTKSKANPASVIKEFKSVINYNKNILVEDLKPAIDRGMMGAYGENYSLDAQTFYKWFTGWMKEKARDSLKAHTAYKHQSEPELSEEEKQSKRAGTRAELIVIFMKYYNDYLMTGQIDPGIKRYYIIFWTWLRKLNLIEITEQEETRMNEAEAKYLRDLREKLNVSELGETKFKIFIKIFKSLDALKIEDQLKSIAI